MNSFILDSDDGNRTRELSFVDKVEFEEDEILLYQRFEFCDFINDKISGSVDCYYINRDDLLNKTIIPNCYLNESILNEYQNSKEYYDELLYDDKKIFIFVLNCFKDAGFNALLKVLNNNIYYEHKNMRYENKRMNE